MVKQILMDGVGMLIQQVSMLNIVELILIIQTQIFRVLITDMVDINMELLTGPLIMQHIML